MLAKSVPSSWLSAEALAALFVMLAASSATFWVLVRRWESHRQSLSLKEWARDHRLSMLDGLAQGRAPQLLDALAARQVVVRLSLWNDRTTLMQFQSTAPQQRPGGLPIASGPAIWNVLVRQIETAWRPTALRPTPAHMSLLDLFSLSGFPQLGPTERFTVFGVDSADARALSASMTRSLLPPDVGLLLYGNQLVLDFSDRPFDEIELDRMLALADQIAEKLPARE